MQRSTLQRFPENGCIGRKIGVSIKCQREEILKNASYLNMEEARMINSWEVQEPTNDREGESGCENHHTRDQSS